MPGSRFRLALLLCFCLLASPLQASDLHGRISWIYDGDTLQIEPVGKVRLLGIDCPESKDSPRRDRYYQQQFQLQPEHLRRIARQVKQFSIVQIKGQQVRLEFDRQRTDRYGRTLAYVYLEDGRMLNRLLLDRGLASVFRRFPFRYKQDFLAREAQAQKQQRGLWQK